ncbi:MAG: cupin domain-containing protein [Acidimicrobiia bacterium]|nr:MAG: cupin domain-containing protein [Acidimicrobiia bacterium]
MTDIGTTNLSDITASLEIPDDGVLSKVLYRDDNIRVVGFAFDTDQELTEHTAAVPVVIQVISGRFRFTTGDETTEIGPESWTHLEASVPHSLVALEPSRLLLTLVS